MIFLHTGSAPQDNLCPSWPSFPVLGHGVDLCLAGDVPVWYWFVSNTYSSPPEEEPPRNDRARAST